MVFIFVKGTFLEAAFSFADNVSQKIRHTLLHNHGLWL